MGTIQRVGRVHTFHLSSIGPLRMRAWPVVVGLFFLVISASYAVAQANARNVLTVSSFSNPRDHIGLPFSEIRERPHAIPIVNVANLSTQIDGRALRRWNIPELALPIGSVILYREPRFWDRYPTYVVAVSLVILAEALLIIGLLWQRARKRKAEAVVRESEQRFRVMADTTPALIWMCDAQGNVTYLNQRRILFTGRDPRAGFHDTWTTYIHPDDRKDVSRANSQALESHQAFSKEYRLRRNDGVYRWMFDLASPTLNGDGAFAGFIGAAIDTTDQKMAQDALARVSGQLIEAQESERGRIARDLHDDICQRLALLSMEIEQAAPGRTGTDEGHAKALDEARKHCSEIASDVQSLSHQLHSSKLDYLGIVAAIGGLCNEYSKQYQVSIEFTKRNVPTHLARDISLCLFRVAQEALHNAVKHSGTAQFSVELRGTAEEVHLQVRDAGRGFNVEEAKKDRGLGLVSMQERVHLVHGRFSVESQPGHGTRVLVVVPLARGDGSSHEDGALDETANVMGVL